MVVGSGQTATNTTQYLLQDWAFVPNGGNALYSVIVNKIDDYNLPTSRTTMALLKFDIATKALSTVGIYNAGQNGNGQIWNISGTQSATWNGLYSDSSGSLFGSEGLTGQIWNFTITQPLTATFSANGPKSSLADGARCLLANSTL